MSDGNQLLLTKRKSCQVAVCLVSLKHGFRFIDDKDKRMTNSMECLVFEQRIDMQCIRFDNQMSKSNFKLYIEPNANFPLLSIITKANKIDAKFGHFTLSSEREKNVEHHGRGVEEEVDEDKVKQY
ncbi:hypothetical protein T4A_105 [Trichinella pseudospiralis]|uniref:Uncharacterized protein n=1 Tax=Trichinella pseudospiralis TaxID=6337 RepID=A0A0V1EQD0_TRIPS|nr:hypothetical protein T4A_105 [Trichinella pseudospiralis]